jgi:hypothetical protein
MLGIAFSWGGKIYYFNKTFVNSSGDSINPRGD